MDDSPHVLKYPFVNEVAVVLHECGKMDKLYINLIFFVWILWPPANNDYNLRLNKQCTDKQDIGESIVYDFKALDEFLL